MKWLCLTFLGVNLLASIPAFGAPLLMDGKKTLYQRVLTTPAAQSFSKPDATGGKPLPAFSSYYVYARKEEGGKAWLQVGSGIEDKNLVWLEERTTIPWKQQMALVFGNPAGRARNLIFKDEETLNTILDAPKPEAQVAPLRKDALAGKPNDAVVSLEPEHYVDFQNKKQFYLLPILQAEERYRGDGVPVRIVQVASLTELHVKTEQATKEEEKTRAITGFRAAVVFVIDTTVSMGPYIEQTKKVVENVYRKMAKTDLSDRIRFGLVAFRSSTKAVPELEYVSRLYADPNKSLSGEAFLKQVQNLKAATVSSPKFEEDSYSGVVEALDKIDWSGFGGRYVILVTDAGAIEAEDPLSSTRLSGGNVNAEAQERGIALYTLHLKTKAGAKHHALAQAQYEALSQNRYAKQPLYYGFDASNPEDYGRIAGLLTDQVIAHVNHAYEGDETPGGAATAKTVNVQEKQLVQNSDNVGHAMMLAYLGRVLHTNAPDFFTGWISDHDFADPAKSTTEVRVFLTRRQLNDLHHLLKGLLDTFDTAQTEERMDSSAFFDSLRSLATQMGRDPQRIGAKGAEKLGESGLFDEYLGDLPYKSDLMQVDFEGWQTKSTQEQNRILDGVRRKIRHYELISEDADRWVQLNATDNSGEKVYPVPLSMMP